MASRDAVPFRAPSSLAVEVDLPNRGRVKGLGIRKGVTLIGESVAPVRGRSQSLKVCLPCKTSLRCRSLRCAYAAHPLHWASSEMESLMTQKQQVRKSAVCCCSGWRLQWQVHSAAGNRGRRL